MITVAEKKRQDTPQILLLSVIVSLFWFCQYVYIPYQTIYLSGIGCAPTLIGIVTGAYGFTQMVMRLPLGVTSDRYGRQRFFIILGIFSAGTASLFRISLPNEYGFFLGNLFSGFASATWISFMILFFSHFQENHLQKASGLIIGANNLGIFLGFSAGTLLYQHFGMHLLCILSAAAALPALFLSLFILEPSHEGQAPPVRDLLKICTDRRLILFSLLALIQQGVQISTSMSFTAQAAQAHGADSTQIGLCSVIYIVTAVLSSYFAASKAAHKLGPSSWIPVILACLTIYCLLIPNLPNIEWFYPAQILSGLSTGILFSFCTSEAMKNIPKETKSTAMGFYQSVYAVGMTLLPIVTGALTSVFGLRNAFYSLAGLTAVGLDGAIVYYCNRRGA